MATTNHRLNEKDERYILEKKEREREREMSITFLLLQLFGRIKNLIKSREIGHLILELNSCKSERLPKNESTIYLALSYR